MAASQEPSTFDFLPDDLSYDSLVSASKFCKGRELYKNATQTVFGEGDISSGVVFVGEQPGDEEDLAGRPFVGPAGRLLDRAFADAGIDRSSVYLTNAVKHFKWKPRGKRRIHEKPRISEIVACDPWLRSELMLVQPRVVVCLGATAAQTMLGADFRVTQERGTWVESEIAERVMATVHPSSILRTPGPERAAAYREFVADLKITAGVIARL
jgi:uracil-DNA glycosylase family protein